MSVFVLHASRHGVVKRNYVKASLLATEVVMDLYLSQPVLAAVATVELAKELEKPK